jgi:hypothetical protein
MGNTLATMQRELTLANTDSARDATEMLNRLEEMAQDRIDLFYDKIGYDIASTTYLPYRPDPLFFHPCSHDDADKRLIPINKVLNKYTYIGLTAEEHEQVWTQEAKEAVKEFSAGPIADGLCSMATKIIIQRS